MTDRSSRHAADGLSDIREREQTYRSAGGVPVHVFRNPGVHSFYISLFVRAGSLYETEAECGMSHFLEHVAVRNVNGRHGGELYRLLDQYGLGFNAATYAEMIQFYVCGASAHAAIGAGLIAELLAPLTLPRAALDAERRRIKAEIRESDERGSLSAFANATVFAGTSLAASILGTNAAVNRVSLTRLEQYRRRVLCAENIFFYVTGNVSEGDIRTLLTEINRYEIGHVPPALVRRNVAAVPADFGRRPRQLYVKRGDFTAVRFTFDVDVAAVPLAATDLLYDMLLSGYNARFFVEMSENKGLFYDISGTVERYANLGVFSFTYEVKERELYDAVALTFSILADVCDAPVPEASCMKAAYVEGTGVLYDDPREFNFTFAYDGHIAGAGYRTVEDRAAAYRAMTPDALLQAARAIFRPENLTLTVKGDPRRIDQERLLALRDEWQQRMATHGGV